jgi:hypothetical protein
MDTTQTDFVMNERLAEIAKATEDLAKKHADAYAQPLPDSYRPQGVDGTVSNPPPVPTPAFRDEVIESIAEKTFAHDKKQHRAKFVAKFRAEHDGMEPTEEDIRTGW